MKDKLARATWSLKDTGHLVVLSDVDPKQNSSRLNGTRRPLCSRTALRLLVERTIRECLNYDDKLVGMPLNLRLSWPMHYTLKSDSMIPELLWLHSSKSTLGKVSESLSRHTR